MQVIPASGQGKYAGSVTKKIIGKTYRDSLKFRELSGWKWFQSDVLYPPIAETDYYIETMKKGNSWLVLFISPITDGRLRVLDVLEVKNLPAAQRVVVAVCRLDNSENDQEIVAVVQTTQNGNRVFKTWRFNREKKQIQVIPIKSIVCDMETGT
jgi:hypothetical protein